MPRLNSTGGWCAGVSADVIGVNGVVINSANNAWWLNDTTVMYRGLVDGVWVPKTYTTTTGVQAVVLPTTAILRLVAGGDHYACDEAEGTGVSGLLDELLAGAGVLTAGRDGTIAVWTDYPTNTSVTLYAPSGEITVGPTGMISSFQVLGPTSAVWIENGYIVGVLGVSAPSVSMGVTDIRMAQVSGVWWVICRLDTEGAYYIAHPAADASEPIAIHAEHAGMQYGMDVVVIGNKIHYAYTTEEDESPNTIITGWIDVVDGGESGSLSDGGTSVLYSKATFAIAGASIAAISIDVPVYPAWPLECGYGRLIHPVLGAFDYEVKPDEWMNIDGDVIIPPVWASTRTLTGAANVLWNGSIRDVVVEERWKALGGLAMPISQLRMLMMIWTNPVDPVEGYVQWYPSYITPLGFNVLPVGLQVGGGSGITFDDVVNYKDAEGNPDGWVTNPVTFVLKLVGSL